jgi:hypothetical protein
MQRSKVLEPFTLGSKKLQDSIWECKIGLEDFTFRFILGKMSATIWCLEVHIVVDFGVLAENSLIPTNTLDL